jgi:hypothetical protein
VDPVPDPLLFSGSAGNRTRAPGFVGNTLLTFTIKDVTLAPKLEASD